MDRYRITIRRDDDTWFVDAIDVPGAHSYGETLEEARVNIRDAIALVVGVDADSVALEEGPRG